MFKIYCISFDPFKTNTVLMHDIITSNQQVSSWWHYLSSTYLIKSRYTLKTLQDQINAAYPNHHFLIVEIDPNNYGGWLPQDAWDWIKDNR